MTHEDAQEICQILGDLRFKSVEVYARSGLLAAVDLMRLSVHEDPSKPAAHKQLTAMLEIGFDLRSLELISACKDYAEAIPEDPEPWISLAKRRLGSNAHRKAEVALEKARICTSRDNRVIDLTAVTSLLATKRKPTRGRLSLAVCDLSNAEAVVSPRTKPSMLLGVVQALTAAARSAASDPISAWPHRRSDGIDCSSVWPSPARASVGWQPLGLRIGPGVK